MSPSALAGARWNCPSQHHSFHPAPTALPSTGPTPGAGVCCLAQYGGSTHQLPWGAFPRHPEAEQASA
eukprot:7501666-Prorocentrum_lima.AAC.1